MASKYIFRNISAQFVQFFVEPCVPVRFRDIEKGMRRMDLPHASGSLQGQDLLAIEIGFLLVVINDDLIAVFIGHAAHAVPAGSHGVPS